MTINNSQQRIVWIDCEMTGLDPQRDVLLEVAALVTDSELNVLGEGVDLVIAPPSGVLETMDPFVVNMHTESGLLDQLSDGVALADAEQAVLNYVREFAPEARKTPLAGNSIATDRSFLCAYMPELDNHLHYRMIDVSSIKELAKRWYPRVYFNAPAKTGGHRALGDIMDSIAELRYYRSALFVPQPGPDSDTAKELAARQALVDGRIAECDPAGT